MKKKSNHESDDDLRDEYDFNSLQVVARGSGRKHPDSVTVELAYDLLRKIEIRGRKSLLGGVPNVDDSHK